MNSWTRQQYDDLRPELAHRFEFKDKKQFEKGAKGKIGAMYFSSVGEYCRLAQDYGMYPVNASHNYEGEDEWVYGSAGNRKTTVDGCVKGKVTDKTKEAINDADMRLYSKLKPRLTSRRSYKPKKTYHYWGNTYDYNRYLNGDPKCYRKTRILERRKTARIGLCFSASCGNDEDTFARAVGIAVAVTRALEHLGVAAEIIAHSTCWSDEQSNNEWGVTFPLKKASEPFDLQKIACVGYPGLLRDMEFCYTDMCNSMGEIRFGSGYGRCLESSKFVNKFYNFDANIEIKWGREGDRRQMEYVESILDQF